MLFPFTVCEGNPKLWALVFSVMSVSEDLHWSPCHLCKGEAPSFCCSLCLLVQDSLNENEQIQQPLFY